MSYPSFIGEFVAPFEKNDWVNYVKWNERRPIQTRGSMNPWEIERVRVLWQQEKAAWKNIETLKKEYREREQQMVADIAIFNSHLTELERVTKKKIGLGPIGQYGSMALAVIPGFGWFSAAFSAINMGLEMLMGNKTKKRIKELMRIMEEAQGRLQRNQLRLGAIQEEVKHLMMVTDRAQSEIAAKVQADHTQRNAMQALREEMRQARENQYDLELSRIRQVSPVGVSYGNAL
jgi:hypothetical protein